MVRTCIVVFLSLLAACTSGSTDKSDGGTPDGGTNNPGALATPAAGKGNAKFTISNTSGFNGTQTEFVGVEANGTATSHSGIAIQIAASMGSGFATRKLTLSVGGSGAVGMYPIGGLTGNYGSVFYQEGFMTWRCAAGNVEVTSVSGKTTVTKFDATGCAPYGSTGSAGTADLKGDAIGTLP